MRLGTMLLYFLRHNYANISVTYQNGATTLSIKGVFATLSITMLYHYADCHYADCCILFIVMLGAFMLSVVMLSVAMLSVVMPSDAEPSKY